MSDLVENPKDEFLVSRLISHHFIIYSILFQFQCGGKNIRFVVMNNILPSYIKMHEKYDLKGSTYKRKASKHERSKSSPTLKDLDFMELHPEGLLMEKDTYEALIKTIQRDCRVSDR